LTRVAPVLRELVKRKDRWVEQLLNLAPEGVGSEERRWRGLDLSPTTVDFVEPIDKKKEHALHPPRSLLRWLVTNVQQQKRPRLLSRDPKIAKKRARLLARDERTQASALRCLELGLDTSWCTFEGPTYPDVFIETPDAVIVIEGKFTEAGPTTHTTWMPGRHQMLRHIDAAWELSRGKAVYGFFIVVAGIADRGLPRLSKLWQDAATDTTSPAAISASLPHRSLTEKMAIAKAFVGITTWQDVCERFDIPVSVLPPRVE
jgi:hypothetical protein